MTRKPPWYTLVRSREPLEQGDILEDCPVFTPDLGSLDVRRRRPSQDHQTSQLLSGTLDFFDVVVLSQSCDLLDGDIEQVILCPIWTREEMIAAGLKKDSIDAIRKGYRPQYHMLEACTLKPREREINIVKFNAAFTLPLEFVRGVASRHGSRARLNSPYREHLSQAFARYLMRVGLPQDIDLKRS